MRILFIGDVVGKTGRTAISEHLPGMIRDWSLDLVIVNGENSAGGFGITEAIYQELLDAGADAITLGNHAWNQKEALVFIERAPRLIRPLEFSAPYAGPRRGADRHQERQARARHQRHGPRLHGAAQRSLRARSTASSRPVRCARRRTRSWSISTARRPAKNRAWAFSATAAPASWSAPTPMCRPPITRCCPAAPPI